MRPLAVALLLLLSACRNEQGGRTDVARAGAVEIELTGRVVDEAGVLPPAKELELTERLEQLENDTTDQFVVVTVPTLHGKTIEEVARALGNGWGIGRADLDNGVLLIVAPAERKVRIEVGSGLEGLLTNQRAAGVISEMIPLFRRNQSVQAIDLGVDEVSNMLKADKRRPQRLLQRKAA